MSIAVVFALGACATQNDQATLGRTGAAEAPAVPLDAVDRRVAVMDTDGDGRLTPIEHAHGGRTMFVAMDANHDEFVTPEEMDAQQSAAASLSQPGRMPLTSAQKIAVIDSDGDGKLSAAEHSGGTLSMFGKMDGDDDGYLTAVEMRIGHDAMLYESEQRTVDVGDE